MWMCANRSKNANRVEPKGRQGNAHCDNKHIHFQLYCTRSNRHYRYVWIIVSHKICMLTLMYIEWVCCKLRQGHAINIYISIRILRLNFCIFLWRINVNAWIEAKKLPPPNKRKLNEIKITSTANHCQPIQTNTSFIIFMNVSGSPTSTSQIINSIHACTEQRKTTSKVK